MVPGLGPGQGNNSSLFIKFQTMSEITWLRLREPHLCYINGKEDFTRAEADVDVTLCNFVKVTGWHLQLHSEGETDVGERK